MEFPNPNKQHPHLKLATCKSNDNINPFPSYSKGLNKVKTNMAIKRQLYTPDSLHDFSPSFSDNTNINIINPSLDGHILEFLQEIKHQTINSQLILY